MSALATYRRGTHRVIAPDQTLQRVQAFARAIAITRVANLTGLDRVGIPVAQAVRPNARSLSVSQGKGLTLDAAKASAVMESIEAYLAEHIEQPLLLSSFEDLAERRRTIDVDTLPRLADSRFHPALRLAWIEGRNLLDADTNGIDDDRAAPTWLPYELVHADWRVPLPEGSGCFPANSNGLASGNVRGEARVHAICELIERDAIALWHALGHDGQAPRRIATDSIDDADAGALIERFDRAGIDVAVWDLTTDLGVPAFRAHTLDRDEGFLAPQPAAGSGCHPDPAIALIRALTEAAQSRVTYVAGARDDAGRRAYEDRHDEATLADARRYFTQGAVRRWAEVRGQRLDSVDAELAWLMSRLRAAGLGQAIEVDLAPGHPDFPLAAVRVVIPGLEGVCTTDGYVPGPRAQQTAGAAP